MHRMSRPAPEEVRSFRIPAERRAFQERLERLLAGSLSRGECRQVVRLLLRRNASSPHRIEES